MLISARTVTAIIVLGIAAMNGGFWFLLCSVIGASLLTSGSLGLFGFLAVMLCYGALRSPARKADRAAQTPIARAMANNVEQTYPGPSRWHRSA
ncbi:MAG TPA: hypothetical protein VF920_03665 [Dongiaceae bacterium]